MMNFQNEEQFVESVKMRHLQSEWEEELRLKMGFKNLLEELETYGITPEFCDVKIDEHKEILQKHFIEWEKAKPVILPHAEHRENAKYTEARVLTGLYRINMEIEIAEIAKWMRYKRALVMKGQKTDEKQPVTEVQVEFAREQDLVQVIGGDITLRKSGQSYMGRCPFHDEKTGSFLIKNNTYYCFGCGAKGDVISYIEKTKGFSFIEAVKFLNNQ